MAMTTHPEYGGLNVLQDRLSLMDRAALMAMSRHSAKHDIDAECGYPDQIDLELYQAMYTREPIPARVVEVLPKESWQVQPMVYEREGGEYTTPFEKAWVELGKGLREGNSWHRKEAGAAVWEYLLRADILSGIGRYGVIFLGFDDVTTEDALAKEVTRGTGRNLRYIRVFPESLALIEELDKNPTSPRYGQPILYRLRLADPNNQAAVTERLVHWSRIIHVADNLNSSEYLGTPRMQQVYNRLLDLRKVYGGSAEMFWLGAFAGLSFESNPALGGNPKLDEEGLREMIEGYTSGLRRWLALRGMTAKSLAPQVSDPTSQILVAIEAICIRIGIPKRVFMGSERGELASSQDDAAWNDRLRERQASYITPRIIVPFVDRLIQYGVLPEPGADGYTVWWPDLASQSRLERADVATRLTQAIVAYVNSDAATLIPPMLFLTLVVGMTDAEAQAALDAAEEYREELEQLTEEQAREELKRVGKESRTTEEGRTTEEENAQEGQQNGSAIRS